MVRVKVCGITRASDGMLACELGATDVGTVFWERSPRAVTVEGAVEIVRELQKTELVFERVVPEPGG